MSRVCHVLRTTFQGCWHCLRALRQVGPGSLLTKQAHPICCLSCALDACSASGQVSVVGASDSSDCFDLFAAPTPYSVITTQPVAWTAADEGWGTLAADCEAECAADPRCQYYRWASGSPNSTDDGCFLKRAPTDADAAADTFAALKLLTSDYTVWKVLCVLCLHMCVPSTQRACRCQQLWDGARMMCARAPPMDDTLTRPDTLGDMQAAVDEYGFEAAGVAPALSGSTVTPWVCLDLCDSHTMCLAMVIHKDAGGNWACWPVDGEFQEGTVTSRIKADPTALNSFAWE